MTADTFVYILNLSGSIWLLPPLGSLNWSFCGQNGATVGVNIGSGDELTLLILFNCGTQEKNVEVPSRAKKVQ